MTLFTGCRMRDDRLIAMRSFMVRENQDRRIGPSFSLIVGVLNLFVCGLAEHAFRKDGDLVALSWLFLLETAAMFGIMIALSGRSLSPILGRAEHAGVPSRLRFDFLLCEFTTDRMLLALGGSVLLAVLVVPGQPTGEKILSLAAVVVWWASSVAFGASVLLLARASAVSPTVLGMALGMILFLVVTGPLAASSLPAVRAIPLAAWAASALHASAAGLPATAIAWLGACLLLALLSAMYARMRG